MYSFPAVKGCPLKVPFVHRLHFVIQIALFFLFLNTAWGSRLPLRASRRQKVVIRWALRDNFSLWLWNESPPLYLPYILSSFSKLYLYIYIHIYSTKGNWCELVLYFLLINNDKKFFWKGKKTSRSRSCFFLPLCLHCPFSLRHWSSL